MADEIKVEKAPATSPAQTTPVVPATPVAEQKVEVKKV